MRRFSTGLAVVILLAVSGAASAGLTPYRVFSHTQAESAMRLAQRQCKPLLLHFVPTERDVAEQIKIYYGARSPIPREDLDRVVVLVIPRDHYPDFATSMGVHDAGGMRTVSPYELIFTDRWGLTTVRETVTWYPSHEVRRVHTWIEYGGLWKFNIDVPLSTDFEPIRHLSTGKPGPMKMNRYLPPEQARPRFSCQGQVEVPVGSRFERQLHALPPELACEYIHEAGRGFEDYAALRFPPVLNEPNAGDLAVLAAVSYVATRAVPGFQSQLQEIYTTRRKGAMGEAIHAACLDALIATTDDRAVTARFLAYVGSQPDPPPGRQLCVDGLQRLQPEATEEMLAYLGRSTDGPLRRRLATLIQRVTRTPSPQPMRFWQDTTSREAIQAAVEDWRDRLPL